jgi:hypothetical protein
MTAYERKKSRIVVWAYPLRLPISCTDNRVLHNLTTVLHVWIGVIELFQST